MKNNDARFSESLTSFALRIYAKPDVASICLSFQDECDCDVLMILWCLWLEQDHYLATSAQLKEAITVVNELSEPLVKVLRGARRQLTELNKLSIDDKEDIKQAILAAEITCEKSILNSLCLWTKKRFSTEVGSKPSFEPCIKDQALIEARSTLNRYVLGEQNHDEKNFCEGELKREVELLKSIRDVTY